MQTDYTQNIFVSKANNVVAVVLTYHCALLYNDLITTEELFFFFYMNLCNKA